MNRRTFLKSTAAAAALVAAPAILHSQTKVSPYTIALVGAGWWGTNILNCALASGRCKLVGLCDVDQSQLQACSVAIGKTTAGAPKTYTDFRELLEKEKPQIVINATPDHWHALITIAAVKSGAHVYVEKPVSHTILEGAAMVKAARAADRVVQVGTHRRLSKHNLSAREFLRSGKLGKIGMVRCFVYGAGGVEAPQPNAQASKDLDWDFWCGPAPLRPFNRRIHPRGFRQFLDYANGQLGDWGVHWLDQMLWIMDEKHPKTIFSTGGRPVRGAAINNPELQTTDAPDHQIVAYTFDNFTATWEHREFAGNAAEKTESVGALFYGSEGTFNLGWTTGWTFYPTNSKKTPVHEDAVLTGQFGDNVPESVADFLDAIDHRRLPASDIETGHRATTCALLGMISLKLGRSIEWDGATQTIPNDLEASKLLRRDYRGPWQYPAA